MAASQRFAASAASLRRLLRWPRSGALLLALAYALLLAVGTLVLLAPASSTAGATAADAFFTTVSAVTLTGLTTVPVQEHWTLLGEGVLAALTVLGGILYLVGATVVLWLLGRRLGMRDSGMRRLFRGVPGIGEVLGVVRTVLVAAFAVQAIGAVALFLVMLAADVPADRALWWGPFHAVSAFNNTGFALPDAGYTAFADDIPVLAVTGALAMLGAIGPLPLALYASRRSFRRLPLDARLILLAMAAVLVGGAVVLLLGEWANPATLGAEPAVATRPSSALFESSARTTGFNHPRPRPLPRGEQGLRHRPHDSLAAPPGRSAAGLKVWTIAVLAIRPLRSALAVRERLSLFGRSYPPHGLPPRPPSPFLFGGAVTFLGAGVVAAAPTPPPRRPLRSVSAISLSGWSVGQAPEAGAWERGLLTHGHALWAVSVPSWLVLQIGPASAASRHPPPRGQHPLRLGERPPPARRSMDWLWSVPPDVAARPGRDGRAGGVVRWANCGPSSCWVVGRNARVDTRGQLSSMETCLASIG